ncbi:hypothetical protein MHBO_000135 [Bonamia ostreae]|uniref:Uncharacterized protein n=1 Tax=Bonamia ostreae TaxID=126728 RepID=A0ABV2AEI8_9EUKA
MVFVNYKNPIRIKIHELSKMEHEPFAVDKKGMADITEKFANSKNMTEKKKILEHLKYAHNFNATQIENFISNIYFYKGPFAEKVLFAFQKNVFKLFSEYEQSLKEAEQLFAEHREAPAGNFFFSPGNIVEKGFNETGKLARNCDSFAAELKRELRIHFKRF